jgi:chromosomal replication initiation ATPase DnaA
MQHDQLLFAFAHRPSLAGDDFLVAPSNRDAVAWIDRWPDWPSTVVAVHGAAGCGKTHLLHVFAARSGGRVVTGAAMEADAVADLAAINLAVDDADRCDEKNLLHVVNLARENGRHLLLAARLAPARWSVHLADLRSRLNAVPAVAIAPPDDDLIRAVLVKLFADRQIRVDDGVVAFLAARMERSLDMAGRLVARIDEASLREQRRVTVPLVRRLLGAP